MRLNFEDLNGLDPDGIVKSILIECLSDAICLCTLRERPEDRKAIVEKESLRYVDALARVEGPGQAFFVGLLEDVLEFKARKNDKEYKKAEFVKKLAEHLNHVGPAGVILNNAPGDTKKDLH